MAMKMTPEREAVLQRAFTVMDPQNTGRIEREKVYTILRTFGHKFDDHELDKLLDTEDEGRGVINFDSFCRIAMRFHEEEEDDDQVIQTQLKEAFRLYDKEGKGYISVQALRELLTTLDTQLDTDQLNEMIEEIDADGSGTIDFDEFMTMMNGEAD